MSLMLILFVTTGMFLTQAVLFHQLPKSLRYILCCVPILAVIINFILSGFLLVFTGSGAMAGASNIIASVLFGLYLVGYRAAKGVEVNMEWRGRYIFRYPAILITEGVRR